MATSVVGNILAFRTVAHFGQGLSPLNNSRVPPGWMLSYIGGEGNIDRRADTLGAACPDGAGAASNQHLRSRSQGVRQHGSIRRPPPHTTSQGFSATGWGGAGDRRSDEPHGRHIPAGR
jgi:hypothetical protein